MRKRKNKEIIDKINHVGKKRKKTQGILSKRKKKVEIKTEIKPPKPLPPPVIIEEVKAAKQKRKKQQTYIMR